MTALDSILAACKTALPAYDVHFGFGADVEDWLTANIGKGQLVYISLQGDEPEEVAEEGYVTAFVTTFAVWVKRRSLNQTDAIQAYAEYLTLRSALNGLSYDGGVVNIVGGTPIVGGGYAESQLQLEATEQAE